MQYLGGRQIFHAASAQLAGAPVEAHAVLVGLHDLAPAVEVEFVGVEDVVQQDGGLAQGDADVHAHGHLGHDAVHLVHQVDELGEGEGAQVGRAGGGVQLAVAGVLGFAAEQHGV